jgi:hypothetical protein
LVAEEQSRQLVEINEAICRWAGQPRRSGRRRSTGLGSGRLLCHFLRDLFGPLPFRPVILDPSWLIWHGGLVVSMARRMYDRRDFSDMSVLADALEEAGCQDQDILGHCRSGGEHVRGCWVVDLTLGKT